MIKNEDVLQFSATAGCVTSKHIALKYELNDIRQVNRILVRLVESGCLEKSGTIRKEGPGKPTPIYTSTRTGFAKVGVKPREVKSLTAITRSLLLSQIVSENASIDFSINIEDKDDIFDSFGLQYPHRDKWYAGNLVARGKNKPHVFVPFTDYQAAVRMCKDPNKRESKATYYIVVSSDISDKVRSLSKEHINPFGIYGKERSLDEWSTIGKEIINAGKELNGSKDTVLQDVKNIISYLKTKPEEKVILTSNVKIVDRETGLIFTN